MTTLTIPLDGDAIIGASFGLRSNTQMFRSPLSGTVQTLEHPGSRWFATYTYRPRSRAEARQMKAFLTSLSGMAGRFFGFDPEALTPRGIGTGTPLVKGASQSGSSLITDGWTINTTGILLAGDFFTVNGELKMLTADANSNGSGEATLAFKPSLRASPADNAPLTVNSATCTMMLIDDEQAQWAGGELTKMEPITFSGVEVF